MARARKASDEIYNERRRLKRAFQRQISQLEKSGASTGQINSLKQKMQKSIQATYAKNIQKSSATKMTASEVRQEQISAFALGNQRLQTSGKTKEQKQSFAQQNAMFKLRVRNKQLSNDRLMNKAMTQGFFMATRDIWQGQGDKYEAILKAFPGKTLDEIFNDYLQKMDEMGIIQRRNDADSIYPEYDLVQGVGESYDEIYNTMRSSILAFR